MRFVVLRHTGWPRHADHYDLMLQREKGCSDNDRVLMAFATLDDQFPRAGSKLRKIDDHRRVYLRYEGAISDDRGDVKRVDEGELAWIDAALLQFSLQGQSLYGAFSLRDAGGGMFELQAAAGL